MLSRKPLVLTGREWGVVPWGQFGDSVVTVVARDICQWDLCQQPVRSEAQFFTDVTIPKAIQIWKKEQLICCNFLHYDSIEKPQLGSNTPVIWRTLT